MKSLQHVSQNRRLAMYSFLAMEHLLSRLENDYRIGKETGCVNELRMCEMSGRIKRLQRKMEYLSLKIG